MATSTQRIRYRLGPSGVDVTGEILWNERESTWRKSWPYERPEERRRCAGTPLDFAQGRLVYTSQVRRCCDRKYRLVAGLLILAVGTGVVVALLADWLNTLAK
jgi:hypothetical protein